MDTFPPTETTQLFQDTAEDIDVDLDFTFDDDDDFFSMIDENGSTDGISNFFGDETDGEPTMEDKPHISPGITSQSDTRRARGSQEPSASQEASNPVKHVAISIKRPAFLSLLSAEELDEHQHVTSSRLSASMERSEQSRRDLYRQMPDLLSSDGNPFGEFSVHQKSQQLASSYTKALRRMTWC